MKDICILCWKPDMPIRKPHRKCGSCGFEMYHIHGDEYEYRLPGIINQLGGRGLWTEIPDGCLLIVTEESV